MSSTANNCQPPAEHLDDSTDWADSGHDKQTAPSRVICHLWYVSWMHHGPQDSTMHLPSRARAHEPTIHPGSGQALTHYSLPHHLKKCLARWLNSERSKSPDMRRSPPKRPTTTRGSWRYNVDATQIYLSASRTLCPSCARGFVDLEALEKRMIGCCPSLLPVPPVQDYSNASTPIRVCCHLCECF